MHFAQTVRKSHRLFASHHRGNGKRRYSGSDQPPRGHERIIWPTDAKPTPYQVLNLETGRPYDKTNFNRLVKMYHPDMQHSQVEDVSPQMRLHRYYLVIAAHELLSSPDQRRRYDMYKMGWMSNTPSTTPSRPSAQTWRHSAADVHDRPSPMRQAPIYMSNNAFAIFALMIAFGYAIVSYERARRAAWRDKQRLHLVDRAIVKSLYDAGYLAEGRSKDERILSFLCRRHVASGAQDNDGGFVPLDKDWEQNICRH